MALTQKNSKYILKSALTPRSKRKKMDNVSLSPHGSTSSPTSCFNRKSKILNNSKKSDKYLAVQVCCLQPIIFLISNLFAALTLFSSINLQHHEHIPSITTTQHIDEFVQNGCIDLEPSPSTNSIVINDTIDPKLGWTTMTAEARI